MRSGRKLVSRLVRLITDMDTQFVSLVNHGANQQPFKVVKNANILEGDPVVFTSEDTALTKPDANSKYAVQKAVFDVQHFDEKSAVAALERLGFSGQFDSVETEDSNLVIKSKYADSIDETTVKSIKNQPGLTMFIGSIKEPTDTVEKSVEEMKEEIEMKHNEQTSQLVIKGMSQEEAIQKFDSWSAGWSGATSLADAMAEGMYDGIPFGANDINQVYWTVVGNAGKEKNYQAIKDASKDLGALIVAIMQVMDKATANVEKSEEIMTLKDQVLNTKGEAAKSEATEEVKPEDNKQETEKTTTPSEDTEETEGENADKAADKTEEVKPEEKPETKEEVSTEGADKNAEAPEEKEQAVTKSELMSSLTELFKKELSPLTSRLDALEGKNSTKKSVEISDEETIKTEKSQKTENKEQKVFKADPYLANSMGSLF